MVLADTGGVEDADGGGCEVAAVAAVSCSICLEVVTDGGHRSWAKLQCGHEFHLDCIGSAFNIKGAMQCPNCRKIEKGQWLYANVSRPLPEFSFEDWAPDEDLYDLSYSEMSFGLHWCPFARVPASFDEGGFSSGAYHDFFGPHAVFAEHTPVSSTSHPCPYVSYFGSIHPSSSASSGSVADGSSFNHWTTPPSGPTEVHQHNPYAFQSMDLHYQNWDQNSAFNTSTRIGGPEQQHLIPPVAQRTVRNSSDIRRASGIHPIVIGHSSTSRAPSSVTSSVLPTYSRSRDSPSALQPYSQQSTGNPVGRAPSISMAWRSNSHRALPHMVEPNPAPPPVDQPSGFHLLPTSASPASRAFQEAEIPHRDRFHHREPEHSQSLFPTGQLDRDSIWGPFCLPGVGPDGVIRSGSSRRRHGSDRMPSQNRP